MSAEKELAALGEMRAKFASVYTTEPPSDAIFFVDDKCLLRYLRARNFDVAKASAMLENTIAWRKSFGVDRMIPEWRSTIELENQTGKMYTRGLDKEGHAIMYMKPSKENTGDFDGNMKHLVFNLEAAVKSMLDDGRGVEKLVLLVDYEGWSLANSPPMKTSQETMNILQNHYPERLFKAVCIHPPFVFSLFWAAICPFIDRVTQAKVMLLRFTPPVVTQKLLELVDADVLESQYGGSNTAEFRSADYIDRFFGTKSDK